LSIFRGEWERWAGRRLSGPLAAVGLIALTSTVAGCNPAAIPAPCHIIPHGQIADRWTDEDRNGGPFGCATEDEHDVPGRNGRLQSFEHGQISWSPDQNLTVAVYLAGDTVHVDWAPPNHHYSYARFLVRWDRDGQQATQRDTSGGEKGSFSTDLNRDGKYSFQVEGCDDASSVLDTGHSVCRQHWTIPVAVTRGHQASANGCTSAKPAIVGTFADGTFTVTGTGFLPNHTVWVQFTNTDSSNLTRQTFQTSSNNSCAIDYRLSFPINGTQSYAIMAYDGRQYDNTAVQSNFANVTAVGQ
jgi:hypothetical protein